MKPRVLFVGGRVDGTIPPEMEKHFEIVKHISKEAGGKTDRTMPNVDYIFIIQNFVTHQQVQRVRSRCAAPIVALPKGWPRMKEKLIERGLIVEVRCAYPRCNRLAHEDAPLHDPPFCSKACKGAARRRGLIRDAR